MAREKEKVYNWNMIRKCNYLGKIYRILNIDMQGGYFCLHNWKTGLLHDIDMDKCKPIKDTKRK